MERLRKLVLQLELLSNDEIKVIEKEQRALVDKARARPLARCRSWQRH